MVMGLAKFRSKPYKSVGDPSSKYGYDKAGKQFEKDIQAHTQRHEENYSALIEFAKNRGLTPEDLRRLLFELIQNFNL
jgi:hypothetical protein